jgi:hypothetical protein
MNALEAWADGVMKGGYGLAHNRRLIELYRIPDSRLDPFDLELVARCTALPAARPELVVRWKLCQDREALCELLKEVLPT